MKVKLKQADINNLEDAQASENLERLGRPISWL